MSYFSHLECSVPCSAPRLDPLGRHHLCSCGAPLLARYDLDRVKGVFSRPAHKLHGQSYVGKVLVLVTAKGGVASAWMLHEMAVRGNPDFTVVVRGFQGEPGDEVESGVVGTAAHCVNSVPAVRAFLVCLRAR